MAELLGIFAGEPDAARTALNRMIAHVGPGRWRTVRHEEPGFAAACLDTTPPPSNANLWRRPKAAGPP